MCGFGYVVEKSMTCDIEGGKEKRYIEDCRIILILKIPLLTFYSFKILFPLSSIVIPYYLFNLIVKVQFIRIRLPNLISNLKSSVVHISSFNDYSRLLTLSHPLAYSVIHISKISSLNKFLSFQFLNSHLQISKIPSFAIIYLNFVTSPSLLFHPFTYSLIHLSPHLKSRTLKSFSKFPTSFKFNF